MPHACQCTACASKRAPTKDAITASGFLTTQEIGPKQSYTPSGFLLCQDVPIARIGIQDYAAIELPDIEDKDGVIQVERTEDVVFDPETIASFEGAPVTVDHPSESVTPQNWAALAKGSTHNVRRGEGSMSDFLLADLLVTDKGAINDITSKRLRELSCGYESDYLQISPGRARQVSIVGNHVALVHSARCGSACSVQDSIDQSLGADHMAAKKGAPSFADKMRKLFMARDSEGFEKALEEAHDDEGSAGGMPAIHIHMPTKDAESEESKKDDDKAETKDGESDMAEVLTKFDARLSSLEKSVSALTKDSDEKVEKEETKDADGDEEEERAAAETSDADESEEKEEKEEKKDDKKSTTDSAAFRDEFQDAKARAEILAPGVKLPTFDAKAEGKKTADSICVLRRRALRASLDGDNAALVKAITGDSDVSKMTCDSAKAFFNAASELVKQKNSLIAKPIVKTEDSKSGWADINQRNADFWSNRK